MTPVSSHNSLSFSRDMMLCGYLLYQLINKAGAVGEVRRTRNAARKKVSRISYIYESNTRLCNGRFRSVYLSGMNLDDEVAPMPGRPWRTGLYVIENSPR